VEIRAVLALAFIWRSAAISVIATVLDLRINAACMQKSSARRVEAGSPYSSRRNRTVKLTTAATGSPLFLAATKWAR
jgi:hypothetical protein